MTKLLADLTVALQPLLLAAFAALVAMGVKWLQAKTKSDKIDAMEARVGDSVTTIVKSLSNTMVDVFKEAAEDGKLSDSEIASIKAAAFEEFKTYWGAKGIEEVKKVLGYADEEAMKKSLAIDIEAAVYDKKQDEAIVATS